MEVKSVSKDYFAISGKLSTHGQCMLWIAAAIVIVGMIPGLVSSCPWWNVLLTMQALLLSAYSFLVLGSSLANFKARKLKINDVIDNAFGTEIGDDHSENYFDNAEIKEGTKRLLYNTAESCFFTFRELKSMLSGVSIKIIIPIVILIAGLIVNRAEVIMAIFRLTAIIVLITQGLRYFVTLNQLDSLLSRIFDTLKHKPSSAKQFNAESINYTVEYETLLVWYGVKIPDRVYHKLNEQLTEEWEGKKNTFVVK